MWLFWIKGLVLGFSIAAPVGPIGLLCIRRTLNDGRRFGLVSGLGAATADAVYGSAAAFGLAALITIAPSWMVVLSWVGGGLLVWLGLRSFFSAPPEREARAKNIKSGLAGAYLSTFLLTITNPMTIFSFLAVFSGMGFDPSNNDLFTAVCLVAGVFCGSALWWWLLSGSVFLLGKRMKNEWLVWVNRAAGAGLVIFGLVLIIKSLF